MTTRNDSPEFQVVASTSAGAGPVQNGEAAAGADVPRLPRLEKSIIASFNRFIPPEDENGRAEPDEPAHDDAAASQSKRWPVSNPQSNGAEALRDHIAGELRKRKTRYPAERDDIDKVAEAVESVVSQLIASLDPAAAATTAKRKRAPPTPDPAVDWNSILTILASQVGKDDASAQEALKATRARCKQIFCPNPAP